MLLLVAFLIYAIASGHGFLAVPFGSTYVTPRNLSCSYGGLQMNQTYGVMYCVLFAWPGSPPTNYTNLFQSIIVDDFVPISSDPGFLFIAQSYADQTRHYGWIRMSRTRCTGFSSTTTDVGYGNCTTLPYEIFLPGVLPILCICATDRCNANLSTCQASVAAYAPSPRLITAFPSLTTHVSCQDNAAQSSGGSITFWRCLYLGSFFPFVNTTLCDAYFANNTVMCFINTNGYIKGYTYEEYDTDLSFQWLYNQYLAAAYSPNAQFIYNESSTQLLFFTTYGGGGAIGGTQCFCTTNNCNVNLSTCATGLNYNPTTTVGTTSASNPTTTVGTTSGSNPTTIVGTTSASNPTTTVGTTSGSNLTITIRTTSVSNQTRSSIGTTFYHNYQLFFFSMMAMATLYIIDVEHI
ncbi:unnamed protein product [Rotaria socialis]|uniref:Uncharacterized protein n=1 Tax=Rotaria socialis TaxID=392032 RepID=A0A818VVK9_9BILA|nr:unnamed protein product [Rotaria socialis]CAF4918596.1 unnamed protein product [Rotaria socialis]